MQFKSPIVTEILAPLGPPIVIPVHNIRTTSALIEWEEIPHAVQYKLAAWSRDDKHYGLYYLRILQKHGPFRP